MLAAWLPETVVSVASPRPMVLTLLLVVGFVLAGCVGKPPASAVPEEADADPEKPASPQARADDGAPAGEPGSRATFRPLDRPDGSVPPGGAVTTSSKQGTTGGQATLQEDALEFTVPLDVSAVFLELAWDDPVQDLNLLVTTGVFQCAADQLVPSDPSLPDDPFCHTHAYFGVPGEGRFLAEGGNQGEPNSPTRLLLRGPILQRTMEQCGDLCPFWARPTSDFWPSVGVAWTIDVWVYTGPSPWDVTDQFTNVYVEDGTTVLNPHPASKIEMLTRGTPSGILAELTWEGSSGVQDLDLVLGYVAECPDADCDSEFIRVNFADAEGGTGAPDDPAFVFLGAETMASLVPTCYEGEWCQWRTYATTHACPNDPAAGTQPCPSSGLRYNLAVTVFQGAIPEGYTALAG
jgi:hypothetical protein